MTLLVRLADRVLGRPLLLLPEKLAIVAEALAGRIGLEGSPGPAGFDPAAAAAAAALSAAPSASRFVGDRFDADAEGRRTKPLPYQRTADGVAVVTITGSLVNRGAWVGASSGLTSYEGIAHQIDSAARDPKVRSIALDLESPGGEVFGAFETAALVRKVSAEKPVFAIVNGMAASAGYAIASGARAIMSTATGLSGSIGVVLMHADYSRAVDRAGITPTFIHAGAHKVDGNPYEPLGKAVRSDLQAEVDRYYDLFLETVAEGRGRRLSAKAARATEARTFIGRDAKDAGLVDEIGDFADLLAALAPSRPSSLRVPPSQRKASMFTQEDLDRARAEGRVAGSSEAAAATASAAESQTAAAVSAAAAAAQTRIAAILDSPEAAGREGLARHLAFKTAVPAEDARATLAAAPAVLAIEGDLRPASIGERQAATLSVGAALVDTGAAAPVSAPFDADLVRAPTQKGAVPWSAVADKLNAEIARKR